MSLFAVQRYLGEEEVQKKPEASDILKQLQEKAKAKKRSLHNESKIENSPDVKKKSIAITDEDLDSCNKEKQTKKQKKLKLETETATTHADVDQSEKSDEYRERNEEERQAKRKRKHKHKADISIGDADQNQSNTITSDNDSFEVVKKKKKKRKHDLSETSVCNESVDNIDDEELPVESKETDCKKKQHKKHKKHKHRHSEELETNLNRSDSEIVVKAEGNPDDTVIENDSDTHCDDETAESKKEDFVDDEQKSTNKDKETEIGGFTVIRDVRPSKPKKVHRVLPEWLSTPNIIASDLTSDSLPVTEMPGLDGELVNKLQNNGITDFFPVQRQVIPALLETSLTGFHTGRAGYRPSDLCVSAPTGSGKTLAFVLPIVQALKTRVTREVRALAVLPVRDLASQVLSVFQTYCEGTRLKFQPMTLLAYILLHQSLLSKVGGMIGQRTLLAEQESLVKKRLRGYESLVDIVVATPGRLVDHINHTEGFSLGHLRYLVIDEADRMMDEIKQDWLMQVETAIYRSRSRPGNLTASSCGNMETPLQKLLYSATLSQNPEKLQQLNLFQPKLFTSVVKGKKKSLLPDANQVKAEAVQSEQIVNQDTNIDSGVEADAERVGTERTEVGEDIANSHQCDQKTEGFVGKYATPTSLTEYYIETKTAEKPLVVLHLLHHLNYRNILCFTNSLESTHRLFMLIKLYGGVTVKEFSSGLHISRRDAILKKFAEGKIDILVCSDALARGMDVTSVKYVVLYDPPTYIQTYIHRIGRTARAGKEGTAITLLQNKEFFHFKKMTRQAGKDKLKSLKIFKNDLKPLLPKYEESLEKLGEITKEEKMKKKYAPKKKQKAEIKDNTG